MNIKEEIKMKELDGLYQEIKNIIMPISNFEWRQIVIHASKDELHSSIGIYYKVDEKYVFIQDMVEEGLIDRNDYTLMMFNLLRVIVKLKSVFESNNFDEWNSMIFVVRENEKCEVYYSFEEWDDTSMRDEVVWKYKYLGIMPDEEDVKYIEGVEQTLL